MTAPRKAHCQEDDDFMAALDRMVAENIHDRGKEVAKPPVVDIAIPWQVKASLKRPVGKMPLKLFSQSVMLTLIYINRRVGSELFG